MIHKHPEGLSCGCAYAERLETKVVALGDEVERLRAVEEAALIAFYWFDDPLTRISEETAREGLRAALNSSTGQQNAPVAEGDAP